VRSTPAGVAAGLGAVCAVGSSIAVSRTIASAPIATTQLLRYAAGAVLLYATLRATGARLPRLGRRDAARVALLAATGLVGFNFALLGALRHADPALVGVIVGATPLVLAIVVPMLARVRPAARTLAAAVVVVGGIAIVEGAGAGSALGILLAVATLAGEVAFTVVAAPLVHRIGPVAVSVWACVAAVVELAVLAPLVDAGLTHFVPTGAQVGALLWLGTAVTGGGFVCWYAAVRKLGADRAGLLLGLIPVVTALTAAAVGTGALRTQTLLGALVVAAGVLTGLTARPAVPAAQSRPADPSGAADPSGPADPEAQVGHPVAGHDLRVVEHEPARVPAEVPDALAEHDRHQVQPDLVD